MTTTAKGLFGLKIPAGGAIIPLDIPWDVRITNIAFGEEVEGSARSVIKVHRARLPDYSDDEFDEFEDDEDDDEDDGEDDEDDEDAADAEEATQAVNGKKASKKTAEDDDVEGEEDEEDDEDDEDSEDDDEDEQWIEEDFVICSLYPKQNEQAVVDLAFCVDEEIGFSVSGDNDVELTGYYVAPDPLDIGSDSEYDEFDEYDEDDEDDLDSEDLEALYGELEEDDEDEETDEEMDDDIQIEELDAAAKAVPAVKSIKAANSKKRSNEEVEEADDSVADAAAGAVSQLSKNQRKKLNKKLKTEADANAANTSVEKVEAAAAKETKDGKTKAKTAEKEVVKKEKKEKITTPSGLVFEDKVVGKGPQAKAGNRVSMRYVGRLTNGKQFDANMTGKPFSFKLGKGEVIAGWDEGIKGMQVGGQRRLTCPPKLAYGKAGAPPDIPSNSTLVFDVKLLEIK